MKTKLYYLVLLVIGSACNPGEQTGSGNSSDKDTTLSIVKDTIPETRTVIKPGPVASYNEPVPDELNKWQFAVSLYETRKTFTYLIRMQYKELRVSDSLKIPDFGTLPRVEIHKGKEPLSCVLGFLDKKGEFKEYKLVRIKGDQLKMTTINNYYVGYRTKG